MKPDIYIHLKKHKNIFFTLKDEIESCFRSININVFVVFMKCLNEERENCYVFFLLLSSKSEVYIYFLCVWFALKLFHLVKRFWYPSTSFLQ